jgi:HEAT repeat protein
MDDQLRALLDEFLSDDPAVLLRAVGRASERYPGLPEGDRRPLLEGLLRLFYLDLYDRPEFAPVQERAMAVVAEICARPACLEFLLEHLAYPDVKASLTVARVLAIIGGPAVAPLASFLRSQEEPTARAMALHALSKVRAPEVLEEREAVLGALRDGHAEVRDTAARTIGKFCEHFKPGRIPAEWIDRAFHALQAALGDPTPPVRAKALRSLGKMAAGGFLPAEGVEKVNQACLRVLGRTDFDWDVAYIVRVEAEEALRNMRA